MVIDKAKTSHGQNADICRVRGLTKVFDAPGGTLEVLRDVELTIAEGEMVSIIGPSGVGKSTLLHMIGALDPPSEGTVELAGSNPYALADDDRARLRNEKLGFVFQFHHLLSGFTALENVAMPLLVRETESKEALAEAGRAL